MQIGLTVSARLLNLLMIDFGDFVMFHYIWNLTHEQIIKHSVTVLFTDGSRLNIPDYTLFLKKKSFAHF